jgi:RimJ/RimL family protein N-acetyltransferase
VTPPTAGGAGAVRLRAYTDADRGSLIALLGDPDVMRFVGDGAPIEETEAGRLFDGMAEIHAIDPAFFIWAVEDEGGYAGHAELKRRRGRAEYELVYYVARDRWGRGIGGIVADALLAAAREKRLPFVIATVYDGNAASRRIVARRGFLPDARLSEELGAPTYRLDLEESVRTRRPQG